MIHPCIRQCGVRLLKAHYRGHTLHRHVVVGHVLEASGALFEVSRVAVEVGHVSLLAGGVVLVLVAIFGEE